MTTPPCPNCRSEHVYFSRKREVHVCEDCETDFELLQDARTHRVFLSYGHDHNRPVVERLREDLTARGHEVWMDPTHLREGDDWRREITEGLLSSSAVLGFLSTHSVRDPGVCLDELRIALATPSAHIQTVLLESVENVSPPSTLAGIQWLDMSGWEEPYRRGGAAWEAWYQHHFTRLCAALESTDVQALEGEITRLRDLLSPATAESKERALSETFYSDRPWLDSQLEAWRTGDTASRILVLAGGPGSGKSMYASHLLHYNPYAVCGVFCEWDKSTTIEPKRVVDLIAFKLACRLADYRRILLELLTTMSIDSGISDGDYIEALLITPLRRAIDGERERFFVVIDGLDEATGGQRNALAEMLSVNLPRLPPWLGFVVTTRPEHPAIQPLAGERMLQLDDGNRATHDDLARYVAGALQSELSKSPRRLAALDAITNSADGSFLYASMFIQGVRDGALSLEDVDAYPAGLDGFYHLNFHRRFSRTGEYRPWRSILEVLAAFQVVPADVVVGTLQLSPYDLNDFTEVFGSFVRRQGTMVDDVYLPDALNFSHKSLVDWLSDPSRSGRFHTDHRLGAAAVAAFARQALGRSETMTAHALPEEAKLFLQRALGEAHRKAGQLEELERFLLDQSTEIRPHFESLRVFPEEWNVDALLFRLWSAPQRHALLLDLQRRGDQHLLRRVLSGFARLKGLGSMPPTMVNMLVDTKHLGGDYRGAVALCDEYLSGHGRGGLRSDPALARIATRRLHHSMFFAPVEPLIADALELIDALPPVDEPDVYNELLFLVGGNLGVLGGDFEFAETWVHRSLAFARERDSADFKARGTRKLAEIYLATDRVEDAAALLRTEIDPGHPVRGRYELYLLAALGETQRLRGDAAAARTCFSKVRDVATSLGIPGWKAHADLGTAMLLLDIGLHDEAQVHLHDAVQTYDRIGQAWGLIVASLAAQRLQCDEAEPVSPFLARPTVEAETTRLGYRYLQRVVRSGHSGAAGMCLQFL